MSAAVRLNGGQFVWATSRVFNAETFQWFPRQLLRRRKRAKGRVVVLDNAGYHHARQLQPFLRRVRHLLTLLFLPALQSAAGFDRARLEAGASVATHNHYFATLLQLVAAVVRCFQRWRKPNRVLHRLCCNI